MNKEIIIKKEHIVPVFNNRFLNVYDNASRRTA